MDLDEFMAKAKALDGQVAAAVGCDRTTISRIRREKVAPSAELLLRLDRWAEECRIWHRWPIRCRLSWDHLLGDIDGGDRAESGIG
jgi:transcriptional regulator with XRE-family HTH domain